ncbi:MAG: hypothetical protein HUK14_08200 [Muribaculaceae bacterium]|nr:hypothetical protein [Muribaculaceae bacterium]
MDIKLVSIEEVRDRSSIHRWELLRYDGSPIDIKIVTGFEECAEKNMLSMILGVRYTAMREDLRRPLLTYFIRLKARVNDIVHKALVTESSVYLPPDLLATLMGVGIGALRGMVALKTVDTPLAEHPLPIYAVSDLIETSQAENPEW